MRHRGTLLLTGFGPFPGMPENESARLVPKLAHLAARRFSAHRVVARILPTEWERGLELLEKLYARERPKVALHFGVSERATGFVIETRAHNYRKPVADAAGSLPIKPHVCEGAPQVLPAGWPVEEIVSRLLALGLPASTSDDAGGYLCNAVLFRSLQLANTATAPAVAGFVHIPHVIAVTQIRRAAPAKPDVLDFEKAIAGGLEIIRTCLGRPTSRRGMARAVKAP